MVNDLIDFLKIQSRDIEYYNRYSIALIFIIIVLCEILYTFISTNYQFSISSLFVDLMFTIFSLLFEVLFFLYWLGRKDKKYSYEDLKEKLNFSPHDLSDFLGLMGDSVDNIPGAPGLGEKTAMVLMGKYKNLENIFLNINDIPNSLGQKYKRFIKIINDNKKIIYLSKKLATLVYIEEIDKNISIFKRKAINIDKLDSFLINTGMKSSQKNSWLKEVRKYGEIL